LARVGAGPGKRLACQVRPSRPIAVIPLLPPAATPANAQSQPGYLHGAEEEIAILFCDLRSFTQFAERRLPYDTVFLLNRFFRAMGESVEEAGGRVDKFIGDGVMALFGVEGEAGLGCRQAIDAARRMGLRLDELNTDHAHDLARPLRIGIGIHVGPVIVGEMGHAKAVSVTAIGDAVNTASRLEALTKELDVQMVVSEATIEAAGLDLSGFEGREVEIRGRAQIMKVRLIPDAAGLPDLSASLAPPARLKRRLGRL
jgi:adenylate cyclase